MAEKKPLPLTYLIDIRADINISPVFQRQAVWTTPQKQLLIDSILRNYDIPKIYLYDRGDDTYDVIDGQQRLRAIWDFFDGKLALPKGAAPIMGIEVKNMTYKELDKKIRKSFLMYCLDAVFVNAQNLSEICEMFRRLQNGTPLNPQEIRNAVPGKIRDFIADIADHHKFFKNLLVSKNRANHDLIVAQMTLLAINKGVCSIRRKNLDDMYVKGYDFDENRVEAKQLKQVLNYLYRMFPEGNEYLKKNTIIISLFLLIMDLLPSYDIKGREKQFRKWFIDFEAKRDMEHEMNQEENEFQLQLVHATDSVESLKFRLRFLKERLLEAFPDLQNKDPHRLFDETQRRIIFHRDGGICQKCHKKCKWDKWHADHKVPHSKGGKTTVKNGRVLCPSCNAKKGAKEE